MISDRVTRCGASGTGRNLGRDLLYRVLRVSPEISVYVRVPACMTGYARNAGFTLAEKTSMDTSLARTF